jgi:dolichol-phosphate mannosyltransferase
VKLVAVIPTYNEAGTLGALIDGLVAHCPDACELHVLVVDDASPDGTADIAAAAARRWPGRVQLLSRPAKQGLALAYVAGFARALADGADYVLQMDADGSHDPAAVPSMLAALDRAEVVIGRGTRPAMDAIRATATTGGPSAASPTARSCASCRRCRPAIRRAASASGGATRCCVIDPMRQVRARAYGFQVEMAVLAARAGCRFAEVPIHFGDRRAGRSKMTPYVQLRTTCEIVVLPWLHRLTASQGVVPVRIESDRTR